jgi:ribosome-binding factor A
VISHRQQRVSELLREELSLLIQSELDDPRLEDALVTVTHVDVSPDLQNASVFVDHALPPDASDSILEALRHAEPFLRRSLAESLDLRVVPALTFHLDIIEQRARRIDSLLDQLAAAEHAQTTEPDDNAD